MARIPVVLDKEVSYGFSGGGGYNVNVQELGNRFEERDERWKYAKHVYNAAYENIQEETRDALINAFHACGGRAHSFMFKDWNDYEIRDQLLAVRPGTSEAVQLYKTYEFGPAYRIRPVQALDVAEFTPFIVDGDDNVIAGTFDPLTGMFTPEDDWVLGNHYLSCNFLVWVRFDDDMNEMTIGGWRDHSADVTLVEDPFPMYALNLPESWDGE